MIEEEVFEEIVEEEDTTVRTVNLADNGWVYDTMDGYLDITATSDTVGWWLEYSDYGERIDYAKIYIEIYADDFNSVTLNYSSLNHSPKNSDIIFGVFDNIYPNDTSGQTQMLTVSSGSITFNLSDVSGTKYVGFRVWGNSYIYDDVWYTRSAGGDMQIISINAEEIVKEEIEEEYPEEIIELFYLKYDANGGSGAPDILDYESNSYATISSIIPTRTGYRFLGWSESPYATSADYVAGDEIYISDNNTLYAVWEADAYTVTYNANGGSGVPSSQTVTGGTSLTLSSIVPERFPYTFLGWSTSSSASSATYKPGDSFTISSNLTLYAVWQEANAIYSGVVNSIFNHAISFGGGYVFYSLTPDDNSTYRFESNGNLDTYIELYDSNGSPLASDDDGAGNGQFLLDYNFTKSTKYYLKVRFYRSYTTGTISFTMKRMYTITYNANGGTGVPSSQTKIHGDDLILSSDTPMRQGYTFLGWSTDSSATYATYQPGDAYAREGIAALYAVWRCDGLVYICDSTGEFSPYQIWIYDDSGWNQYVPYIYNGSSWELYS